MPALRSLLGLQRCRDKYPLSLLQREVQTDWKRKALLSTSKRKPERLQVPVEFPGYEGYLKALQSGEPLSDLLMKVEQGESRKKKSIRIIIYTLLKDPSSNRHEIVRKSGLPKGTVYSVMDHLAERKIVATQPLRINNATAYSLNNNRAIFYIYRLYHYKEIRKQAQKENQTRIEFWDGLNKLGEDGFWDSILYFTPEAFEQMGLNQFSDIMIHKHWIRLSLRDVLALDGENAIQSLKIIKERIEKGHVCRSCSALVQRLYEKIRVYAKVSAGEDLPGDKLEEPNKVFAFTGIRANEETVVCVKCSSEWTDSEHKHLIERKRYKRRFPKRHFRPPIYYTLVEDVKKRDIGPIQKIPASGFLSSQS